jgi:hypothetical protein
MMASRRLYNYTIALVPAQGCAFLAGNNSENGSPDPWKPALICVILLGIETDGKDHYRVSRHYTIRPAIFTDDEEVLKRILAEQIAAAQEETGEPKDLAQVHEIAG